ncbi:MAG: type II toxin-antitoxin system VapC family toxin [Saprospiraceae bacterium]|nr:type II toxin-antitoxin system VapC family toxin [Saprospiraceae bacterium]MCF8249769.1 type II toxin-antitoxin system VapC family toxin [Saprospiraceae bacterium]MCF8279254.1 type II toxin-antitoxin system VapC family toxin [Bacteroidales bacterium]MCF8312802.1 type II toxin-antitoxin system VapC family toxin [Saprospiraceae bacterium]MCF8441249.1 type II toxin-antitoxin system VapC family toxin [Saprospiraceae bacterium]
MNILVDKQAIIWYAENNPALTSNARQALDDASNSCYLSMASFWEMSIKINLGKLNIKGLSLDEFMQEVEYHGFTTLEISKAHILKNGLLSLHHRDPFDRLLIAQALVEDWHIITSDDAFDAYEVKRIW